MTDVMDEAKRLLKIFTEQLAENERLTIKLNAEHLVRQNIEVENAKLRELVRDMWLQLLNAYDAKELDEFADRMRELGMEVDA